MRKPIILTLASAILVFSGCCCPKNHRLITVTTPNCRCCDSLPGLACTSVGSQQTTMVTSNALDQSALVSSLLPVPPAKLDLVDTNLSSPHEPLEDSWTSESHVSNRRFLPPSSSPSDATPALESRGSAPGPHGHRLAEIQVIEPSQFETPPIPQKQNLPERFDETENSLPINSDNDFEATPIDQPTLAIPIDQPSPAASKADPSSLPEFRPAPTSQPAVGVPESDATTSTEPAIEPSGSSLEPELTEPQIADSTTAETPQSEQPIVLYARPTQSHSVSENTAKLDHHSVGHSSKINYFEDKKTQHKVDDQYGLPTTNAVEFTELPAMQNAPKSAVVSSTQMGSTHMLGNQQGAMLVVYRDEEGRLFLAPPTPHTKDIKDGTNPLKPQSKLTSIAPAKEYYVEPMKIIRLKATTPIGQPRPHPSVASILMRDTVIADGTHLLKNPELKKEQIGTIKSSGDPVIDYEKLREAIRRLTPTSQNEKLIR